MNIYQIPGQLKHRPKITISNIKFRPHTSLNTLATPKTMKRRGSRTHLLVQRVEASFRKVIKIRNDNGPLPPPQFNTDVLYIYIYNSNNNIHRANRLYSQLLKIECLTMNSITIHYTSINLQPLSNPSYMICVLIFSVVPSFSP